jgi:transposase
MEKIKKREKTLTDFLNELIDRLDEMNKTLAELRQISKLLAEIARQEAEFHESIKKEGVKTRAI